MCRRRARRRGLLRTTDDAGSLTNPMEEAGGLFSIAVGHGQPDVVKLLLDLGFDPDERIWAVEQDVPEWARPAVWARMMGTMGSWPD